MANNEYDQIAQEQDISFGNPYDDAAESEQQAQATDLQQSMYVATKGPSPEQQARFMDLSKRAGLATDVVARNEEQVSQDLAFQDNEYDTLVKTNPKLSAWLTNTDNATLAKDDIQNLRQVEDTANEYGIFSKAWKKAKEDPLFGANGPLVGYVPALLDTAANELADSGFLNDSKNALGYGALQVSKTFASLPSGAYDIAAYPLNLTYRAMGSPTRVQAPDWLRQQDVIDYYSNAMAEIAPEEMSLSVTTELQNGNFEKAGKALALQVIGNAPNQAILIASALTNPTAGLMFAGVTSAGASLEENRTAGVDPVTGVPNALTKGVIEAGFEKLGTIGFIERASQRIAKQYGKDTAQKVVRDAFTTIMASGANEFTTEFGTQAAQGLTDYISGIREKPLTTLFQESLDSGLVGLGSGVAMSGPTTFGVAAERGLSVRDATLARDAYLKMGENIEKAKTQTRSKEAMQDMVKAVTEDTSLQNVYIPVEGMEEYFQSKGIDPISAANEMNILAAYNEAKETGGDIKITLADYANKVIGTPHWQGLQDDVKFDPNAQTMRQAREESEAARAELEAANKETTERLTPIQHLSIQATSDESLVNMIKTRQRAERFIQYTEKRIAENAMGPDESAYMATQVERIRGMMDQFEDRPSKGEVNQRRNSQITEIRTQIQDDLQAAGLNPEDSKAYSALYGERYITRAERRGLNENPIDLFRTSLSEIVRKETVSAEAGFAQGLVYNQEVSDFKAPEGFFESPKGKGDLTLPELGAAAIEQLGVESKPVVIKESIAEKNATSHPEIQEGQDIEILKKALYAPTAIIQSKPNGKPNYYTFIREEGKSSISVIEINANKDNFEVVNWYQANNKKVEQIKNRATREGGRVLITEEVNSQGSAGLSDLPNSANSNIPETVGEGNEGFSQEKEKVLAGRIRFKANRMAVIELMQHSDLSTVLHESGHLWLEELIQDATIQGAPDQLKADMDTLLKWMGSEVTADQGEAAVREAIKTEQHELFARGFEAYLMEGKAPTKALRKVFAKFKIWLTDLYRNIANLRVPLNDDVRAVMTRLVSAEQEAQKVEADLNYQSLFTNPRAAGMTEAQADRYLEARAEARRETEEVIRDRLMEDITKQQKEWYKEAESKLRPEIEAEANDSLVYQTYYRVKDGTLPDGSPLPEGVGRFEISRQSVIDKFGSENAKMWPKGMLSNDGVHIDLVAEMYGWAEFNLNASPAYNLAEQMTRFIPMKQAVEGTLDAEMRERYPDIFATPQVSELAVEAAHNNARAEMYKLEMEYLAQNSKGAYRDMIRTVGKWRTNDAAVREQAVNVIGEMSVDEIKPHRYQAAERKLNKQAHDFLAKGDHDGAIEAKRKAFLNHELYRAAKDASDQLGKDLKKFKTFFKNDADLAKTRDMDIVNAARSILADFGIGKSDKTADQYLAQMKEYDPDTYASVQNLIAAATEDVNFDNPTFNDFVAMSDGVKALWDFSRTQRLADVDGSKVEIGEIRDIMNARIDEIAGDKELPGFKKAVTEGQERNMHLLGFKSRLRRMEHWAYTMDSGDINGPFTKYVYRPIRDAETRYNLAKAEAHKKINDLKNFLDAENNLEINAREIGYTFKNKHELLAAMLHTGNESNMWKLLVGRRWGQDQGKGQVDKAKWDNFIQRQIKEGVLKKKDFDFLQAVWDLNETFKADAWRAHKDMYGYYPNEITAREFTVAIGDEVLNYKGGYVPAIADPRMGVQTANNFDKEQTANLNMTYALPTTGRGFTKSRAERHSSPMLLDLNKIPSHIDKVLKFTHLEPAVKQVNKTLTSESLRGNLSRVDPTAIGELITPFLQRAATQTVSQPTQGWGGRGFDKFAAGIRSRTSLQVMAMNVTNWIQNLTSTFPALVRVDGQHLLGALNEYRKGPSIMADEIMKKSDYMKVRMGESTREISKEFNDLVLQPSKYEETVEGVKKAAYIGDRATNGLMERVVWAGAYRQEIANGNTEKEAVKIADSMVRQTQTDASPSGIAGVEGGTAFVRLFNMFSTYFNNAGNLLGSELAIANQLGLTSKEGSVRAAKAYGLVVMAPAIVSALIARFMAGKGIDEDDDGEYIDDALEIFFGSQARFLTAMIPGGAVITGAFSVYNDKPYDDRISLSPIVSATEQAFRAPVSVYKAVENEKGYSKAIKDAMVAIGMTTGAPTGVISRPAAYLADVSEGKAKPSNPADVVRGLVTGQPGVQ